jgi:hypothetical protein
VDCEQFYACPRASVFHGTQLDADLRTRGIKTLVMAGISSTGAPSSTDVGNQRTQQTLRLKLNTYSGC